jgi:hypothetical protein
MNTLKNYGLGGVALVIAIFALFLPTASSIPQARVGSIQQNQTTYDSLGSNSLLIGANCNNGLSSGCVKGAVIDHLGNANVGISADGMGISFVRQPFANTIGWATTTGWSTGQATTTPCSILSPAATSTIDDFSIDFTVGTSTTATVSVASSTSAFSTTTTGYTTLISAGTIAAGTGNLTWTPTAVNTNVVPPSTYITTSLQGATTYGNAGSVGIKDPGFQVSGACTAVFRTII